MAYKGPIEAALSSDLRGEPYNFSLWDIYTGTQIVVFKGNKDNVLQVWSIYNRKCQDQKLFLPGRPSVICMSPCGQYLVVGIYDMIYIWQLRSGYLLAHGQKHYQTVSVLRMNHDGTFLISGGEDGAVLVWPFADFISNVHHCGSSSTQGVNEPRFTWQHHSAQVTDVHITNGGRCLSSSTDQTVNLYNYKSGRRLYCIALPVPIWSVAMDKNETRIFSGGRNGNIYETVTSSLSLSLINSKKMNSRSEEEDIHKKPMFTGHKDSVTSLVISADGTRLISASKDSSCKIWNIQQRKMLLDIKHQAALANLSILLVPESLALASMSQSLTKPPLQLKPLKRQPYKPPRSSTIMSTDLFEEASTAIVYIRNQNNPEEQEYVEKEATNLVSKLCWSNALEDETNVNAKTLSSLKEKIQELYTFSAEKIFHEAAQESLKPFKTLVEELQVEEKKSPPKKKVKSS